MTQFMRRFDSEAYAALRIVTGLLFLFLFLCHGTQKLSGFPLEPIAELPVFVTDIAGPIELLGGMLVLVGLDTRWVAFLCSGLMAAGDWMAHGTKAFFPIVNGGELAALHRFVFLLIAARGPGIWSIDARRGAVG